MTDKPKCSYFECPDLIADSEIESKDAMKFCETHKKELVSIVDSLDVKGILRFWIKAQGGAKMAAQRTLHGGDK